LDKALEKPGKIFIIPAKLEECDLPSNIKQFQAWDMFRPGSYKILMQSLNKRAEDFGFAVAKAPEDTKRKINTSNSPLLPKLENELVQPESQNGSKIIKESLSALPHNIPDMLLDADDAYYGAEYELAINLYRQVLKLDPENDRAKNHIAKAEIKRITEESSADLPRVAKQYYLRARSYIAARDFLTAMKMLSASVESAQERGMAYPDAERLLNSVQDYFVAEEFKQKANLALEKGQWNKALDFYDKALSLDPTNQVMKIELESLQSLFNFESELRNKGILKIFSPIGKLQKSFEAARVVLSSNNPMLSYIENQIKQIRLIRIGGIIIILVMAYIILKQIAVF
jgi:tetratricopeptide (TPR) repeat protein